MFYISKHKYFDNTILLIIMISSLKLVIDTYSKTFSKETNIVNINLKIVIG